MALRPPPRAPPYKDYEELIEELTGQFNVVDADGTTKKPPSSAESDWSAAEIQMWFASGGAICPPDDPKMRAKSSALAAKSDFRSPAEVEADQKVKQAQDAARKAPWFSQLTEKDMKLR